MSAINRSTLLFFFFLEKSPLSADPESEGEIFVGVLIPSPHPPFWSFRRLFGLIAIGLIVECPSTCCRLLDSSSWILEYLLFCLKGRLTTWELGGGDLRSKLEG